MTVAKKCIRILANSKAKSSHSVSLTACCEEPYVFVKTEIQILISRFSVVCKFPFIIFFNGFKYFGFSLAVYFPFPWFPFLFFSGSFSLCFSSSYSIIVFLFLYLNFTSIVGDLNHAMDAKLASGSEISTFFIY